ncbi:MAG: 4-hydroxy-tetrahydrodipicolinate synthase [Deltaproteobacteria bacterium]|nr:4-hydroxy-tetrahydrodipicolinate synthase [Deltaproteobacteria bacterium]
MQFSGVITALATPFRDGKLDLAALEKCVERQIAAGVHGLVACGCTGEAATMSADEDRTLWRTVKEVARGRVPVIAGAGSNSTATALEHALEAQADGCDAVMLITPYYNKPTQEGLYRHYRTIADGLRVPVMLYNVPGRTACHIEAETVARLAKDCANIVGLKEASGTVAASAWAIKLCPPGFSVLSGDDPLVLPLAGIGVRGVVSVASNVAPAPMVEMWNKYVAGDRDGAAEVYYRLLGLFKALFIETNPIPVKAALAMMGLIADELRLPLVPMTDAARPKLHAELEALGLV